ADAEETKNALDAALAAGGPFYMRLRRDKEPILQKGYKFKLGKAETMREGSDLTIAAFGPMVDASLKAAAILKEKKIEARVINVHTVKPLDADALVSAAKATGSVVTVEDHSVYGGLGGAVAEALSERYPVPVKRLGAPDVYGGSSRNADAFLKEFGLTPEQIATSAEQAAKNRR
ncbi:TPA: transketolase family protein, partial [Candidatus Bathyarchaeota archaeon]|nr:transketolase family protein [Candidatus Bathyarchaeota archaeon]